jgi:DNA repair protein SbcD/Mre11
LATILHTADLHLGRGWGSLGQDARSIQQLQWECFEKICRIATERGAVALVIAGDVFDVPDPGETLVKQVTGQFRRLATEGVSIIIAPGTHDAASHPATVYSTGHLGRAKVFTRPCIGETFKAERGGRRVNFSGLAWDPQNTEPDYLDAHKRSDSSIPEVLVLHADVGAKRGRRNKDLPATAQELAAADADYVALGHRHAYQEYRSDDDRLWGGYCGSPFGLSFRGAELGSRSASLVTFDESHRVSIEQVLTTSVEWTSPAIDISQTGNNLAVLELLRAEVSENRLCRIRLSGAADFRPEMAMLLREMAGTCLHFELEDESVELSEQFMDRLVQEQSVRGIFVRRMRERLNIKNLKPEDSREVKAGLLEGLRVLAEEEG